MKAVLKCLLYYILLEVLNKTSRLKAFLGH